MDKTGRCLNKDERISPNRLTKYEKARLLGTRTVQIDKNAPVLVETSHFLANFPSKKSVQAATNARIAGVSISPLSEPS